MANVYELISALSESQAKATLAAIVSEYAFTYEVFRDGEMIANPPEDILIRFVRATKDHKQFDTDSVSVTWLNGPIYEHLKTCGSVMIYLESLVERDIKSEPQDVKALRERVYKLEEGLLKVCKIVTGIEVTT